MLEKLPIRSLKRTSLASRICRCQKSTGLVRIACRASRSSLQWQTFGMLYGIGQSRNGKLQSHRIAIAAPAPAGAYLIQVMPPGAIACSHKFARE